MKRESESKNAAVQLENVSKAYDDINVLQNLNLTITAGEFVTVLGRSGSGKTTMLRLLNGLIAPSGGIVRIRGQNIADVDRVKLRRTIGYAIQGAGLFPHMRIKDNIAYVLTLQKTAAPLIKARVDELIDLVQLEPTLLNRYPDELSGGQRQRVGIARALAAKPDILLMDEPFGAVDDLTRAALQDAIKKIHQRLGVTIVFVTHDVSEALSLATSVLIMNNGRIEQYAPPKTLINQPSTEFVESLIKRGLVLYEDRCLG